MSKPHDKPSKVTSAEGEVLIDGPDGMTSSMTPEAALETARRLGDVAVDAIIERGQHGADGKADQADAEGGPAAGERANAS